MDEFLSDIYMDVFKKWVLYQNKGLDLKEVNNKMINKIEMENDVCESYISFNENNIIELYVNNKVKNDLEFYLHFQMKNLRHATTLFYEMKESIDKIMDAPRVKVLLCCSGGLTTTYFSEKIKEAIELLNLDIEISAIGYHKVYSIADEYDIILLAPQIAYQLAQCESLLKNKIVKTIPPRVFAKYDVNAIISMIQESLKEKKNKEEQQETLLTKRKINLTEQVLCLSVYKNSQHNYINYRVYDHQEKELEKEIVKNTISFEDICNVIDITLLSYPKISKIAISIPGIIDDGVVSSSFVENINGRMREILEAKYHRHIILSNDVNSAALGYYVSQNQYDTFSFLFQPIGLDAGLGTVIDGKLITGKYHLAGEVKFLPIDWSDQKESLEITPDGITEMVYKQILTIVSILSPEHIVLYSDLIDNVDVINNMLKETFKNHINDYNIDIVKITNLQEYILLGLMKLCSE